MFASGSVSKSDAIYRCANPEHQEEMIFLRYQPFVPCNCGCDEWDWWVTDNTPPPGYPVYLWINRPGLRWGTVMAEIPVVGQTINIKQRSNVMTREAYVGSYRIVDVKPGSPCPTILLDCVGGLDPTKPLHHLLLTSI